jgi:hypothetical protein
MKLLVLNISSYAELLKQYKAANTKKKKRKLFKRLIAFKFELS